MAPRNQRCRNCPGPRQAPPPALPATISVVLSSEGEGQRIWEHVQTAAALLVGAMEGYVQFGLAGASRESLAALRGRLDALIDQLNEGKATGG